MVAGLCPLHFTLANTKDVVEWGGTTGLACSEAGKDEMCTALAKAIIGGEVDNFIVLCRIKRNDAACPDGNTRDSDVEEVKHSFGDGAFGGVVDAKWDG